jgi:hypothetical protein
MDFRDVIAAYDRAWNEPDRAVQRRLIDSAFTDDAELIEPRGRFAGPAAISERLAGFQERFPGGRVEITTGIDEHHGYARYGWTLRGGDGAVLLEGIDVCELAPDGRLRRVVMFFGNLPDAPA